MLYNINLRQRLSNKELYMGASKTLADRQRQQVTLQITAKSLRPGLRQDPGGTPMMHPQHVPVNRPPFLNCHYPDDPLFYFAGLS